MLRIVKGTSILPPLMYAAISGTFEWLAQRSSPLAPDAVAYLALANSLGPASLWGGRREPIWPALMAPLAGLLGGGEDAPRLLGVVGFVFMAASFQFVVSRLYGRLVGLASSLILVSSPWLVYQAARGLREETAAGMLLMFGLMVTLMRSDRRSILGAAVLAGVSAMLRWDTVLVTLPVLCVGLAVNRVPWRVWIAAIAAVLVLVSPLVVGNWFATGDPLYHSNVHAKYFRNQEFAGRPGFPTLEEVARDSFAGPDITWTGYLFGLHDLPQLAQRTLRGTVLVPYAETYKAVFYSSNTGELNTPAGGLRYVRPAIVILLIGVGILSSALLLLGPAFPLGLIALLSMAEFAPIGEFIDLRLALSIIPFALLGVVNSVTVLARRGQRNLIAARMASVARLMLRIRRTRVQEEEA